MEFGRAWVMATLLAAAACSSGGQGAPVQTADRSASGTTVPSGTPSGGDTTVASETSTSLATATPRDIEVSAPQPDSSSVDLFEPASLGELPDTPVNQWNRSVPGELVLDAVEDAGVIVLVVADGAESVSVVAIDKATGGELWRLGPESEVTPELLVIDGALIVSRYVDSNGSVAARIDLASGRAMWRVDLPGQVQLRHGRLVAPDVDQRVWQILNVDSGQIEHEASLRLWSGVGWVERLSDTARVVDFESFEPIGPDLVLPEELDATSANAIVAADRVVVPIESAITLFGPDGSQLGGSDPFTPHPILGPVVGSDTHILANLTGLVVITDVTKGLAGGWQTEFYPEPIGIRDGVPVGWHTEYPPAGGRVTVVQELETGTEICRFETPQLPTLTTNGFLAGGTALGFDCRPRWTVALSQGERVIPLDQAMLIVDDGSGTWEYFG